MGRWTELLQGMVCAAWLAGIAPLAAAPGTAGQTDEPTPCPALPVSDPQSLQRADQVLFRILVARIEGDEDGTLTRNIRASLRTAPDNGEGQPRSLSILPLTAPLTLADGGLEQAMADRALACGRSWLREARGDLLIWGDRAGDGMVRLRFLASDALNALPSETVYTLTGAGTQAGQGLTLPIDFDLDLSDAVAAVAIARLAPGWQADGRYMADILEPLAVRFRALARSGDRLRPEARAEIRYHYAGTTILLGQQLDAATWYEETLWAATAVTEEWTKARLPDQWAGTQNILGAALSGLGELTSNTLLLNEALAAYRRALTVITRSEAPLEWATLHMNIGTAFEKRALILGSGDDLDEARAAFNRALEVLSPEKTPLVWAMVQNNLGIVLYRLSELRGGMADLDAAVAAYRRALGVYSREQVPLLWAGTQNNLGNALTLLGERRNEENWLEQAVAAYRLALESWTREKLPMSWAMVQNNLGGTLLLLGNRNPGTQRLEEALRAFNLALLEWTRETVPDNWASVQDNIGSTLTALGQRETGTARLEEAIAAFRRALEVRGRDRVPMDWAVSQNNLGIALVHLGQRLPGPEQFEDAIEAFQGALTVLTRKDHPAFWGDVQNNLGIAYSNLGERLENAPLLEQAVAAYRRALEVRVRAQVPLLWAATQNNLGAALFPLGLMENGTARLEESATAFRLSLEVFTRAQDPRQWALTLSNLGAVLVQTGLRYFEQGDLPAAIKRLEAAAAGNMQALEYWSPDSDFRQWADTTMDLALALGFAGILKEDLDQLRAVDALLVDFLAILDVHPEADDVTKARARALIALLRQSRGVLEGSSDSPVSDVFQTPPPMPRGALTGGSATGGSPTGGSADREMDRAALRLALRALMADRDGPHPHLSTVMSPGAYRHAPAPAH